jgi:ATP-dependent HslUV protease ATP-binding subunit HslU
MNDTPQVGGFTPREIVSELDRYVVGQHSAKKAVALALRNRWRRQQVPEPLRDEITPKNIIMIGPTGVGKTEIARRLAKLAGAPFVKVEASKFTEVGYVGRDVESMIRDLVENAVQMVRAEALESVHARAVEQTEERLLGLLLEQKFGAGANPAAASDHAPQGPGTGADTSAAHGAPFAGAPMGANFPAFGAQMFGPFLVTAASMPTSSTSPSQSGTTTSQQAASTQPHAPSPPYTEQEKAVLRTQLRRGELDDEVVTIELADPSTPMMFMGGNGMEDMEMNLKEIFNQIPGLRGKSKRREVKVAEARALLEQEEATNLLDMDHVHRDAVQRTEQMGIVFLDEIDKVAGRQTGHSGPDVSREGVQRDLLPVVEGSTVSTRYGPVKTDHILFIAAGAFHVAKVSDLIPELQGRFPIRVELKSLEKEDFVRILTEPKNALTRQQEALMQTEGIALRFEPDAIDTLAEYATEANRRAENIGARRLHTLMEALLEEISFTASERAENTIVLDGAYVRKTLGPILANHDLANYIL